MRLVSDNLPEDVERKRVESEIVWPLRELAANILRVVRGAGRPERLVPQMVDVLAAFEEVRRVTRAYPSSFDIQAALDLDAFADEAALGRRAAWDYALRDMVRGGLQMAASELLGQRAQESAGESELFNGLAVIEEVRAKNRRVVGRPVPRRKPSRRTPDPA